MTFFTGEARYSADVPPVTPTHVGVWLDGSHMHPDDFSMGVIGMAVTFGAQWVDETDAEAYDHISTVLSAPSPTHGEITDQEHEFLIEASDEALTWLTCNVAPEDHVFFIEESTVFLEAYGQEDDPVLSQVDYYAPVVVRSSLAPCVRPVPHRAGAWCPGPT